MAERREAERERLHGSQFAYVDKEGGEHLPIHDAAHVRNAIARFNQTGFESEAAKERARKKILAAAQRFGIEVSPEDKISKPVTSLRAAARRNVRKAQATRSRRSRSRAS